MPKHNRSGRRKDSENIGRVATMANNVETLPQGVQPPLLGARMRIWKQDPTVSQLGTRTVYIHGQIDDGPSDSQIRVSGVEPFNADINGDFLVPNPESEQFDGVHTYAVVRQVLTLYQRTLGEKLGWQWNTGGNTDPITIFPRFQPGRNARYVRGRKSLEFFHTGPVTASDTVFVCRSLDVVAHEAGHAVLDSLQPGWNSSFAPPQTGGLHESFGDLTAILLILSQFDLVEFIVAETKADLHEKSILNALAEQFGNVLGRESLRMADNNLKLSEVNNQVHRISQVFTGAVYDILADIYSAQRKPRTQDDAEVLFDAGKYVAGMLVRAIRNAPDEDAIFSDLGREMVKVVKEDDHAEWATFIEKHFSIREIIGVNAFAPPTMEADMRGCCGTMRLPEMQEV